MIAHHQRSHTGPISLGGVSDLDDPAHAAVFGVERYQVPIGDQEIQPILVHRDAAVANMQAMVGWVGVVPDLVTGERVDCPQVVGHTEVQHTIDHQWGGFNFRTLVGLKSPGERQAGDILRRNLFQLAMPLSVVRAVVQRPAVRRWIEQHGVVDALRPQRAGERK
jgi:hypothetical protein